MREIKYRGKEIETGEWKYGYYGYKELTDEHFIIIPEFDTYTGRLPQYFNDYIVNPKTVGQYTGFKDEKGVDICEGDIDKYSQAQISFLEEEGGYCLTRFDEKGRVYSRTRINTHNQNLINVIGNIHDNPELIKQSPHE